MARRRNTIKTVQITISTTQAIQTYLEKLVETGLFGKNPAEAAERLIAESLKEELAKGLLASKKAQGDNRSGEDRGRP